MNTFALLIRHQTEFLNMHKPLELRQGLQVTAQQHWSPGWEALKLPKYMLPSSKCYVFLLFLIITVCSPNTCLSGEKKTTIKYLLSSVIWEMLWIIQNCGSNNAFKSQSI
jgi:predicted transglutaminase-like protease